MGRGGATNLIEEPTGGGRSVTGIVTVAGYLWSGRRLVGVLNGSGVLEETFVWGARGNIPDEMVAHGQVYRILADARGSVRLVVDAGTGQVMQALRYSPWGRVIGDTDPGFQPFGYAGGLYDRDTGLVHFGARDYDPYTGRWTAKDPILFKGGETSLYGYAGDDPVNFIDPSGLYCWNEATILAIAGAAGGALAGAAATSEGTPLAMVGGAIVGAIGGAFAGYFSSNTAGNNAAMGALAGATSSGTQAGPDAAGGEVGGLVTYGLQQAGVPDAVSVPAGGAAGGVAAAVAADAAGLAAKYSEGGAIGAAAGATAVAVAAALEAGNDCGCGH